MKKYLGKNDLCHKKLLGVQADLLKCWRGTWSEKGWEPLLQIKGLKHTAYGLSVACKGILCGPRCFLGILK